MPIRFKLPAYAGNSLLLLLGIIIITSGKLVIGGVLAALAVLDLYLVYKLDQFSQEEVWLQHELEMAKLREELFAAQKRIADLQGSAPVPPPAPSSPSASPGASVAPR